MAYCRKIGDTLRMVLPKERRILLTIRAFAARIRIWGLKESLRSKKTPSQYSRPVVS